MSQSSYHNWSEYARLIRFDRPIGSLLLLWPTLMALWGAAGGCPSVRLMVIYTLGVFVMRSAGCAINDWADRDIDGHVERTKHRPLASKSIHPNNALIAFMALLVMAFLLVSMTNVSTMLWSIGALILASTYPFMKRYTHYPQAVLGAAFAWGIPMAYASTLNAVPFEAWVLFSAMFMWTMAFDTAYAMADKIDDLKVGVKSTAIAFGQWDKVMVAVFQTAALFLFAVWGYFSNLGFYYGIGLLLAVILSMYQLWLIRDRDRANCLKAFLNNQWIGLSLFAGMALDYLFYKT